MAPRRGPALAQGMVSHPYPMAKDTQPLFTTCELCDRTFPSKDWTGHKNGKAHREREKDEQAENSRKLAAANGHGFAAEGFTPDPAFGGNDGTESSNTWGASGGIDTNFLATGFGGSNEFSNSSAMHSGGRPQGGACYGCGEIGHSKRDCPSTGASRGCFGCGEQGHNKANCPNPSQGGGRGDRACFNCGIPGHNKADCTEPRKQGGGGGSGDRPCYNCGETGHMKMDCPNPRGGGGGGGGGDRECFQCYQKGHSKNDCPNEKVLKCRNCDEIGHHSKECPKPRDYSRVQCNNCKQFGHTVVRCKEPPAEEAAGGWDTTADTTSGAVDGSWSSDNAVASSGDWANAAVSPADQWGGDGAQW